MSVNIFSSKKIVGAKGLSGLWARQTFFDLSIGIDETNTFQINSIGIDETNTFQFDMY